ncbi:MAG: hypothetical protein COV07_03550 [Candidatus Vogelbacteria bacterium CG10_big_fil_rev_8_21_14_0_10_45_14]|uniref:Uncharacterized protein n=1 Tax=Candidatus Vogelbacteria bacterium CG10_big_fil_rev_8_21_14_0_10_45_14 TaxID=1975042 RepID=A0A2H0RJ58_9BACT|nr:MAG: hypothetical protein COV07_03550 [Candidatus Vogelbacteria bacterium CG10_big_fil_rev_8_21_14_0_10_45_14]
MNNPLKTIWDRKWSREAFANALTIFRVSGIKVISEKREYPSISEHLVAARRAGKSLKKRREIYDKLIERREVCMTPLPGFTIWHYQNAGESRTIYMAETQSQGFIASALHAATCGCDGCWSRIQGDANLLRSGKEVKCWV